MSVVGKKLFVGNLPYDTSDQELERVFSEHGEVKACFTVKENGVTDKCKGYGYVVFTSKEACEKARTHVKVIEGRPVKISLAQSKKAKLKTTKHTDSDGDQDNQSDSDESDYEALTAKGGRGSSLRKPKSARGEARFDVGRTVLFKPLPPDASEEQLRSLCEGKGQIVSVSLNKDEEAMQGLVTFNTHKEARSIVHQLSSVKVGGAKVNVSLLSRATKGVSQSTIRKSRLIVRNISFKCEEAELERVFGEYGRVLEVKVPRKENGYMLGYAFVQFGSYFDAAKALEGVNGRPIRGRPVAVDWVVPKSKYEQALRKTTPTVPPTAPQVDEENEREESVVCESSEDGDVSDSCDGSDPSDGMTVSGTESDEMVESESDETEEQGGRGKPASDVTEGRTLFIRNLPVGTDYKELSQLFSQFGPVRYCRVLTDSQSGLSRGTAFLQFKMQKSVQPCQDVADSDGLHYHGNKLVVSVAVSKNEAQEFNDQKSKVKEDKRNLYLAKEGLILPGTTAAEQLSKVDMARRMRAYSERKAKLANPNFFVSKTRLSVRNLPTGVDEKMLKRIFLKSADVTPSAVSQLKILRSTERVDGRGLGRSKGFGFIEFKGHEDALKALRSTNNNPELFGEKRRLIVEFAIENSRALNLRTQRKHRQIKMKGQRSSGSVPEATPTETSDPHQSKRQKWRQKWKSKRLKRKEQTTPTLDHAPSGSTEPNDPGTGSSRLKSGRKQKARNVSSLGPARVSATNTPSNGGGKQERSSGDGPPPKRVKQQAVSRDIATHQREGKGRNQGSRKQRSKQGSQVEEANFENMVNKYRQKLEKSTFSKWAK